MPQRRAPARLDQSPWAGDGLASGAIFLHHKGRLRYTIEQQPYVQSDEQTLPVRSGSDVVMRVDDPPNRTEKNSWAHPVVAGGKLYLRDQDVLLCYSVKAE